MIDFFNKTEKISLIDSADKLIEIRDPRNQIAHEYIPEALFDIIPDIFELFEVLEKNISASAHFIKKRDWVL